ncbi:MAG: GlsB/YeaQ/YmgE family stress response membrane protein [Hyphomicrobium aestuarii]|nr:GlsB/YeaQ/YmgE family stress response membrane protein [Hyphomicrobium aestuarii]
MPIEALLVWLVIGAIAGFLAGTVVKGYGFGLVGNIVVGIIGAVIAGALLPRLGVGFNSDIVGQILSATLGAIGLLLVIGVVRRTA